MASKADLLEGPLLKLRRSSKLIETLEASINCYVEAKHWKLMVVEDIDAAVRTYRAESPVAIPADFSLLLGDAIHNMRAALDFLMFAMAGDRFPEIAFPFCKSKDSLPQTILSKKLSEVAAFLPDIISALEPYPGGAKFLHELHSLDIVDKHRLILVVAKAAQFSVAELLQLEPGLGITGDSAKIRILGDAAIQISLTLSRSQRRQLKGQVRTSQAKIQPEFQICFGGAIPFSGQPIIPTLRTLHQNVSLVINEIADRFVLK